MGIHWRELFLSLLLAAAYVAALFFYGTNLDILSLALALLTIALGCVLWWSDPASLHVPKTALFMAVLLYWAWLAVSLAWNPVTYIGTTASFWWQSILPMAFVAMTLMADRARIVWQQLAAIILLAGVGLSVHGTYQALLLNQLPRSLFLDANMYAAMLNLIALPTAGYLLRFAHARKTARYLPGALAAALLLMFYAVMLTRSRGSIVTLIFGLGLIAAFTLRYVPRRALLSVFVLALLAYAGAELSLQGDLTARLGTLTNPAGASPERLLIWQQSWLLLQHSPWWGVGVGLYPLVWARYRYPGDGSAGYFAHNDYLQLWIEAGVPGLVLFLAVLTSAGWLFVRLVRDSRVSTVVRTEAAGLIAGLAAIAAHALIEFPFYIAPILIVYGLILARLQHLAVLHGREKSWIVPLGGYFSRGGFRVVIVAATLLPLGYFVTVAMSSLEMRRGISLAEQGRLEEADLALTRAMRLRPDSDSVLIARADLRRHILGRDTGLDGRRKATLFEHADGLLAEAERLNPLRPVTYVIRAELYRLNPELAGVQWRDKVEQFYRAALECNPRFYPARYLYGSFVLNQGDVHRARRILDEGASHAYAEDAQVAPYLLLTAALRERTGDAEGAKALRERLAAYNAHRDDSITFRSKAPSSLSAPGFAGVLQPTISAGTGIDFTRAETSR